MKYDRVIYSESVVFRSIVGSIASESPAGITVVRPDGSRADIPGARVLKVQRNGEHIMCEWFVMCEAEATNTVPHPVLGDVPVCNGCQRIAASLSDHG